MKSPVVILAAVLAIGLGGCATDNAAAPAPAPSQSQAASGEVEAFLAKNDLAGMSAPEIIEKLEATNADRETGPIGSVRPNELILSGADKSQVSMPITDKFYLSFAPYATRTHDCFNHNLASCQGELPQTPFEVTVVDSSGATLVNETLTSHDNGFVGVWLPKDITGTITVRGQGKEVTSDISTSADDPTCLTTLKLT
ncbi:CueP family metal-binding protein [Ammonicoccus fulvus]|uniref:CueP family metal-binding protein n=1 Tax=Ammonicoccus fulvus TaxID=3138240 RepID=A0ABZ3FRE9_9ACTN